jgi:hypothetical protein
MSKNYMLHIAIFTKLFSAESSLLVCKNVPLKIKHFPLVFLSNLLHCNRIKKVNGLHSAGLKACHFARSKKNSLARRLLGLLRRHSASDKSGAISFKLNRARITQGTTAERITGEICKSAATVPGS